MQLIDRISLAGMLKKSNVKKNYPFKSSLQKINKKLLIDCFYLKSPKSLTNPLYLHNVRI